MTLNHIAIIMDGNGRWAHKQNMPRTFGHLTGLDKIKDVCEVAINSSVKYVTLFALSTENLSRPSEEVSFLFSLIDSALEKYSDYIIQNKIILNVFGDLSVISTEQKSKIDNLVSYTWQNFGNESSDCSGADNAAKSPLMLNIAFNYSGKTEIIRAANKIKQDMSMETISTEADFNQYLDLPFVPVPELLIRTGGHMRISNFLLWQLAYTELYFSDILWPDVSAADFEKAVEDFYKRRRNFGLVE